MNQKQFLCDSFFTSFFSSICYRGIVQTQKILHSIFIIALALVQQSEGGKGVCAVNKKRKRKKAVVYITYINNEKQWIRRSYDIPVIL